MKNDELIITDRKICCVIANLRRFRDIAWEDHDMDLAKKCEAMEIGVCITQLLASGVDEHEVGHVIENYVNGISNDLVARELPYEAK